MIKGRKELLSVAVEPEASPVISGGKPGPHKIQGIGGGFIPRNLNMDIIDDVIKVTNETAFDVARAISLREGISVGISSGANVAAAIEVAKRSDMAGKRIVTVAASFGERYLSTALADKARGVCAEMTAPAASPA